MSTQAEADMTIVLDDFTAGCHRCEFDIRLLQFRDRLLLTFGGSRKQRQRFVAQPLDRPKCLAPRQIQAGSKRIRLGELDQRCGRNTHLAPEIIDRGEWLVAAMIDQRGSVDISQPPDHA